MTTVAAGNVRNTIGKYMLADGMDLVIDLEKSHGSWLVDGRDNKEFLDLFSMFASMSVGYNHPYVLENKNRLTVAALNKPTNSDVYSTQMAQFVETIGRLAQPEYLPYAFYVEGGALAVENALKAAFDWKVRKNRAAGKQNGGSKIIHFKECFHGRSGYTLSLTDSPDKRKTEFFPKFDWPRIDNPKLSFPETDDVIENVKREELKAIAQITAALDANPGEIAGLIIEPIQGEGGDNHFREAFFRNLRKLADDNDFLLIYDEVQTGAGISGKMWAHQHYSEDCRPDIICFGKKTQVCGIFAGKRLDEVEGHVFKESSRINSTWGGNLVDMVRFTIYLEIIENEKLVEQAAENGAYLKQSLESLQKKHPEVLFNIRNRGLFGAFDLKSTEQRDKALTLIAEEGALMLGCGYTSIRFRPHLNISQNEIDQGIHMIDRALSKL
ncbi:MAG: L-lysine 6-transaminase [Candidatus Marinimicrobia bacterium]|jgi:L-lysine 6-transaminase|nr:L-lysine 6-transaminase [Candidatus Neomarinimicrobiota bacterium]MBT3675799.1 L-lysine 6-transaminase [Candidatus Neomarinimicrobiota bacterium]MBT3762961.1 L-lysine 6-transaminase [Candidatus Neomarinimicrobiota bacterium]MBT4069108.1 L-lysine 6-transaminase [Candidatus Neomarinimicrobiota bacterium]MBT4271494.1 L-lysine 6-transaminase [Candidatus Neomarinimicrobiota bacterium]